VDKKTKVIVSGIGILGLLFIGIKLFAKAAPKTYETTKKKVKVIIGDLTGSFEFPSQVTTRSGTNLRASSSTTSTILKTYNAGVTLYVIGDKKESDGQWFQVVDDKSNQGWVRSDVVDYKITNK
jgi:uncharacterized protein YgiM (DUF1202 family)